MVGLVITYNLACMVAEVLASMGRRILAEIDKRPLREHFDDEE